MTKRKSRKSNKGLLNFLLNSPWQVSVFFTIAIFVLMKWVIPSYISHDRFLGPLADKISGIAPFSLLLLFLALISYLSNKETKSNLKVQPSKEPSIAIHNKESGFVNISTSSLVDNIASEDTPQIPHEWSIELLRSIEWKRFEYLCAEFFKTVGKRVETIEKGADGGLDARVYDNKTGDLEFAIQCKAWSTPVSVKALRELYGVMIHENAKKCIFMTTNSFTQDAKDFALSHKTQMFLIDGEKFVSMIKNLPEASQKELLEFATKDDYTVPSCPSCGIKLVQRTSSKGNFWGCRNYPKCKTRIYTKAIQ